MRSWERRGGGRVAEEGEEEEEGSGSLRLWVGECVWRMWVRTVV